MPFHGYPDHSGGPEMYDDARPDEPCCEVCGSKDDIAEHMDASGYTAPLCVGCTATVRMGDEKAREKGAA